MSRHSVSSACSPSNLLVTYGELNALPDYIVNAQAIETCPEGRASADLQTIARELLPIEQTPQPNQRFDSPRRGFGPSDFVYRAVEQGLPVSGTWTRSHVILGRAVSITTPASGGNACAPRRIS